MPTTNMQSISAQQQPTQKTPWSTPMRNASRAGARPCQREATNASGVRHCSRQRYFRALNWNSARRREHRGAYHPGPVGEPDVAAAEPGERAVRGMREKAEREPGAEEAGDDEAEQARGRRRASGS